MPINHNSKTAIGESATNTNSQAIMKSFVDNLKAKKDYNDKPERHHIVARKDWRATLPRIILCLSGIGIEDESNLVDVKKGYHRVLHTNLYYAILNISFCYVYFHEGPEGVAELLDVYKQYLGGKK